MANKIPIALKGITTFFERIERHQIPKIAVRFFFCTSRQKGPQTHVETVLFLNVILHLVSYCLSFIVAILTDERQRVRTQECSRIRNRQEIRLEGDT